VTPKGRDKTVRYWVMAVEHDPGFAANDEVDVAPDEARALLSYDNDRGLLDQL
jgi:hypothetical protein